MVACLNLNLEDFKPNNTIQRLRMNLYPRDRQVWPCQIFSLESLHVGREHNQRLIYTGDYC